MQRLRRLIRPAMECLLHEETMDGAVELFAEIMTSFSYFLRDEDRSNLSLFLQSQVVLPRLHEIGNGDQSPEDRKLVGLYVAFADATVESLVEIPDDETSKFLLGKFDRFPFSRFRVSLMDDDRMASELHAREQTALVCADKTSRSRSISLLKRPSRTRRLCQRTGFGVLEYLCGPRERRCTGWH